MSKINLTYDNTVYTLEYSRQSVKTMESQGFVLDEVTTKPATRIPELFSGAFIKNHRGMKRNKIDAIFDDLDDKSGLMNALIEMYAETLGDLMDGEGNATWAVVK